MDPRPPLLDPPLPPPDGRFPAAAGAGAGEVVDSGGGDGARSREMIECVGRRCVRRESGVGER